MGEMPFSARKLVQMIFGKRDKKNLLLNVFLGFGANEVRQMDEGETRRKHNCIV